MRKRRMSGSVRGLGEQSPLSTYPFGWDYVIGGNTTGFFPDETFTEVDGDTVTEVTYTHTGGGRYEPVRIVTYENEPDNKEDE